MSRNDTRDRLSECGTAVFENEKRAAPWKQHRP